MDQSGTPENKTQEPNPFDSLPPTSPSKNTGGSSVLFTPGALAGFGPLPTFAAPADETKSTHVAAPAMPAPKPVGPDPKVPDIHSTPAPPDLTATLAAPVTTPKPAPLPTLTPPSGTPNDFAPNPFEKLAPAPAVTPAAPVASPPPRQPEETHINLTPGHGIPSQPAPATDSHPNITPPPRATSLTPPPASAGEGPLTGKRLLDRIVQLIAAKNGSDIHMVEGDKPRVRLHGDLLPLDSKDHPVVTREDILDIMDRALTPEQKEIFEKYSDIDFSLEFTNATGRVNVGYANARKMHLVMRYLRADIIPIDQIGLDVPMLKKMCDHGLGVIMVAGETSSGKTTTITAMLDYINHQRFGSIQTIENPVEYSMTSNKCLITRREIGRDTPDFLHALRASVRKNPDVLLIGEVRDQETANIALTAAETGIQTFCTIHAIGAIPAITRLRNILASGEKSAAEFYQRLSHCLAAIISQQLIKASDNSGVIPIYEILNMGYAEKNYLRDGDFPRLEHSLETDHNISMGHCVYRLWHSNPRRINEDTIRKLYHDQFRLMMNRLEDVKGWKPMGTGI